MLRMIIEGVGFDQSHQTVVVLKDWEGQRLLPIWIGPSEAKAIALELEGGDPGRPLSYDVLLESLALAQGRVARVVINDLQESTFFATIDIDTPNGMKHIDSRPSDAIAVAVRAKCPVFVAGGAIDALVEISEVSATTISEADLDESDYESAERPENLENELRPAPRGDDELDRFKRLIGDIEG